MASPDSASDVELSNAITAHVTPSPDANDVSTLNGSQANLAHDWSKPSKPSPALETEVELFRAGFPLPDAGSKRVGVVFEGLTVYGRGVGGSKNLVETLPVSILNSFNFPKFLSHIFGWHLGGGQRPLISDFYGMAGDGETLLVLGRPGSGCSTLLRAITNVREPFAAVDGHVQYSTIDAAEAKKYFDGEIVFNGEDEIHLPLLKVEETLDAALRLKEPRNLQPKTKTADFAKDYTHRLVEAFGMPHTKRTLVGDHLTRGVSGGERKRVSLTEMLAINAAIVAWDNSIRGLDSAVALHYFKILRELSRATGMTNVISTYQTSQDQFDVCDRVIIIYEGMQVFSGLTTDAERYFIQQGWQKKPRQSTPDFLTSCTSPRERRVRKDFIGAVPETPLAMAEAFKNSPYFAKLQDDIAAYNLRHEQADHDDALRKGVKDSTHPLTGAKNPYRKNFFQQVAVLVRRQFQLTLADKQTFISRIVSNILQSTLIGAIVYKPSKDAIGAYGTAGGLFFAILYYVIFSFGEIPTVVNGRPLMIKHRTLGFYNPAAQAISQIVIDIPLYVIQTLIFSAIIYFLMGLNSGAKYFFTFWFIIFTVYNTLSSLFRMIGSWSPNLSVAIRMGGLALATTLSVSGFVIPAPQQLRWISWLRRASPATWAFESLLENEFRSLTLTCSSSQLVPTGQSYTDVAYQACTIIGAEPGSATVSGQAYVLAKYGVASGNIWRNVGILWAMFVGYTLLVILGSTLLIKDNGSTSGKIFDRPLLCKKGSASASVVDEKSAAPEVENLAELEDYSQAPVFTYQSVDYTVQVDGKDKKLLDSVSGLVQPGRIRALMGASGAGKTTLLECISQRKTTGKLEGEFLIDGKPLDSAFSRRTGFVMQGDVHEPMSTVRECLQFSAVLRQDNNRTREERIAFADEILKLLELEPLADALIGNADVGGLGVEERKRVTIGVELAADPESLLFLDEPTSGLDSQAAFEIVTFLRKITKTTGLALVVVVHQPSGDLFEMFDDITLLAPGGKTVYSGPTGENAATITGYFSRFDAHCPPEANPAEFIIDQVAPVGGSKIDWPGRWRESPENAAILTQIAAVSARNAGASTSEGGGESAPFATDFKTQTKELITRNFKASWRFGAYWTSRLVTLVFFGMFSGFFGYHLDRSPATVQSAALLILLAIQCAPPLALDIAVNFKLKFSLWLARERNGVYGWKSLVTALIVTETPVFVFGGILLFFCDYWTVGWTSTPEAGALVWLTWVVFSIFSTTFGLLLGAFSPTIDSIPFVLSLVWNLLCALSWALVVYSALPTPFRYFFSWIDPLRYIFGTLMTATLGKVALTCREQDFTIFEPPSGQTCAAYAADFLQTAKGYIGNPEATTNCQYCSSNSGMDYVEQMGYRWDRKWSDWAIIILFSISNVFFLFLFTWVWIVRPLYKK